MPLLHYKQKFVNAVGPLELKSGSEILKEFQRMFNRIETINMPPEPSNSTGVWLPEYVVYPYRDLDEFSFPVSVEYKDELDGSPINRDMRKKKPEVRAVLTASLTNVLSDFTGKRDKIEYNLLFFTNDKRESSAYKWEPTETFQDLIPKGMMEINELSPQGRESNKSLREMEGDVHGGKIPRFLRDIFKITKSYMRDENGTLLGTHPKGLDRIIETKTNLFDYFTDTTQAATPLTRLVFKSAMNTKKERKEVFEMQNLYTYQNPTDGSSTRFVWVPRKITGLLNWVSLRGRGFSNTEKEM